MRSEETLVLGFMEGAKNGGFIEPEWLSYSKVLLKNVKIISQDASKDLLPTKLD